MRKNIVATCPYFGRNGFVNHSRNFFTHLSKYNNIYIKDLNYNNNYSYNLPVIGKRGEDPNYAALNTNGQIYDIVLAELHEKEFSFPEHAKHHTKIGYYVWESTHYYPEALERMQYLDQIWVPSKWQRDTLSDNLIEYYDDDEIGYKIRVVPEGIDPTKFNLENYNLNDGKCRFLIVGSWEHRKYTTEMVRAFIEVFGGHKDIELVIMADNQWAYPYRCEDFLKQNFTNVPFNVKTMPFINSDDEYIKILKSANCLLSVSRAEGWSLPVIEAMACGIPVITLDWSGQTEYIGDYTTNVMIKTFKPVPQWKNVYIPGYYAEPDYDDLKDKIKYVYENYSYVLSNAISGAKYIADNFTWDKAAIIADHHLNELEVNRSKSAVSEFFRFYFNKLNTKVKEPELEIAVSYIDGVRVDITGGYDDKHYQVLFINSDTNELIYDTIIRTNSFAEPFAKYYINWEIKVIDTETNEIIYTDKLNMKDKEVLICIDSDALGDNIAWFPYVEEFRKLHDIKSMFVFTPRKELFMEDPEYYNLIFIDREDVLPVSNEVYAKYVIGACDNNYNRNKNNWRSITLQQVATDVLGMEYKPLKPRLNKKKYYINDIDHNYVTISPDSTMQAKLWNRPGAWQEVCDYIREFTHNNVHYVGNCPTGTTIENIENNYPMNLDEIIFQIANAKYHIGLGSGLSWVAWALDIPVVLISGFSKPFSEFNCYRVFNDKVCNGCYSNPIFEFDRSWMWCPCGNNWECTREITPDMVIEKIRDMENDI